MSHTLALHAVIADLFQPEAPRTVQAPASISAIADDDLIAIMFSRAGVSKDGKPTLEQLWAADPEALGRGYPDSGGAGRPYDASSADAALSSHLAFWCGRDEAQIERLMRRSALARDKWERADYLARTIARAVERQEEIYKPSRAALPSDAAALFGPTDAAAMPTMAVMERPADAAPEFSEDALALAFVAKHPEFCWTPGTGWMHDDGILWTRDDMLKRYDAARAVNRAATTSPFLQPTERKRIASAKAVNAVLSLAQSDPSIVVPTRAWDADVMAINTPGGIVDIRTGGMRARTRDYVTQVTSVTPVPGPCPVWTKFLLDVFCEDLELIEFMQRSIGFWFTGSRLEQLVWFLYGRGANGKSVLMDFLNWLSGSYGHKLPTSALMASKMDRHPTELAQLRGKRLVRSSELDEGTYFNESLLKELTGDETLTARFMRGDPFEFVMTHKHVLEGNFRPRLRGGDPAIARRMVVVPFNATFQGLQRDQRMGEKLKAEAPAILAWIVEGARRWFEGGLTVPATVRDASSEYMEEHDDTALWLAECCEIDPAASTRAAELYGSFRNWKTARGEHAPSQTAWGPRMAIVPGITKRKSSGIVYTGVRLRMPFMVSLGQVG